MTEMLRTLRWHTLQKRRYIILFNVNTVLYHPTHIQVSLSTIASKSQHFLSVIIKIWNLLPDSDISTRRF